MRKIATSLPVHLIVLHSSPDFKYVEGNVIHHVNGNPFDNRLENLHYLTAAEHNRETALTQYKWKDKIQAKLKEYYAKPENKKKLSERSKITSKKLWEERRDYMLSKVCTPELKEKRKKGLKEFLADPDKREKWSEKMKEAFNDPETKKRMSERSKAMHQNRSPEKKREIGAKISAARMGHEVSQETREKISKAEKGQIPPNKGLFCWNNGEINRYAKECPGEGCVKGMLKKC